MSEHQHLKTTAYNFGIAAFGQPKQKRKLSTRKLLLLLLRQKQFYLKRKYEKRERREKKNNRNRQFFSFSPSSSERNEILDLAEQVKCKQKTENESQTKQFSRSNEYNHLNELCRGKDLLKSSSISCRNLSFALRFLCVFDCHLY